MMNPTSQPDAHVPAARQRDRTHHRPDVRLVAPAPVSEGCPGWCIAQHAVHEGEEDWLHTGEPLLIADGISARLCMSIDPATGDRDGPYVLVGTAELTLVRTARLGSALLDLGNSG